MIGQEGSLAKTCVHAKVAPLMPAVRVLLGWDQGSTWRCNMGPPQPPSVCCVPFMIAATAS
eukprot:2841961-Amphidinium_carterae.1